MKMELRANDKGELVLHKLFTVRFLDGASQQVDEFELWAVTEDEAWNYLYRFNLKHGENHKPLAVWENRTEENVIEVN